MDIAALAHTHIRRIPALRRRCIARHTSTRLSVRCRRHPRRGSNAQCKHIAHQAVALQAHSSATEGRHGTRWSAMHPSAECASDGRKWGKNAGCTAAQRGAARKLTKPCARGAALMQYARNADTAADSGRKLSRLTVYMLCKFCLHFMLHNER